MIPVSEKSNATILGVGTANPPTFVDQNTLPDYYFRITKSEHLVDLKPKFARMCKSSMIDRRYTTITEEVLNEHPSIGAYNAPSLNIRQELLDIIIPQLGAEAASKAIADGPASL
ncbi:uncharacterized protein A4U43_C04F3470 [Asparagus officinalis]|uniref:chalcone synthase n=1 Tax=Asparagus officinalis TaxID=4686 RepID=A0A5P1F2F7_ASPOF|nr:uncharacterized protein A4U43_C04F3470 [Asparagus officinalis]